MKQKLKKVFENAVWWSGVITVGLVLGVTLQVVKAWTEPTDAPPNGNVGAPVNTGILEQTKQGGLGVLSLLTHGFQMPDGAVPGAVLTAKADLTADPLGTISTGQAAWAAGTGGGGGIYTAYGTTTCASGWSVAYTGILIFTTVGTQSSPGVTPPICSVDPKLSGSGSPIGAWVDTINMGSKKLPCAVCVK
jgi:hypothetical protein